MIPDGMLQYWHESIKNALSGESNDNVLMAANMLRLSGDYVEIGTHYGGFADKLCRFTQLRILTCVDAYRSYDNFNDAINSSNLEAIYQAAQAKLSPFQDRVRFLREFSAEASKYFLDGALDLVYIDANHQYEFVYQDLCAWYPKVRRGGLVCGDDLVDRDESSRSSSNDVEIVWSRDDNGKPVAWGQYGVLAALRTFCEERDVSYIDAGTQFIIVKK